MVSRPASRWVDLGIPVHYVDHGGPAGAPLLVCVHGLGGSLVNWAALAPLLTDSARVVALDLAGFGHTQGGPRSTSLEANQELLDAFLRAVAGVPVILVGNSMGGLISAQQAARRPESVAGMVLIDAALPTSRRRSGRHPLVTAGFALYAVPRVGRAVMAARRRVRTPEQIAHDVLRLCCVDPSRVSRPVLDQHACLAAARAGYAGLDEQFLVAARSLVQTLARRRELNAMLEGLQVPVLLLHGEKDRLVPVSAARYAAARNPSWRLEVAENVGHVPQLEAPEWTAGRIRDWLDAGGRAAYEQAAAAS